MDEATVAIITGAVDYGTIIAGIGAVGASVAILLISMRGMKALLGAVKGS